MRIEYDKDSIVFKDKEELMGLLATSGFIDFVDDKMSVEDVTTIVESNVNNLIEDLIDTSVEIVTIANTLAHEAQETLEFLMSRNASPESISGMAVIVYHAKKLLALGEHVGTAPLDYLGERMAEELSGL